MPNPTDFIWLPHAGKCPFPIPDGPSSNCPFLENQEPGGGFPTDFILQNQLLFTTMKVVNAS